jgi:nucleotide-binding universal stress UspA family protein
MYRSVLVPLDGSKFGEQALPLAVHIARRCEARLELINVFAPLGGSMFVEGYLLPNDEVDRYLRQRQVDYLRRTAAQLREKTAVSVAVHAVEGAVDEEIRRLARDLKTDLIVMATHARSPLGRFWLGSVADDLLRDAPAPVLLVPPVGDHVNWEANPLPRHLLVPLDGTPLAEEVLEPAAAVAALEKADLTLLHILKPIMPMSYHLEGGSLERVAASLVEQIEAAHAEMRKKALAYLDRVATPLRTRGLTVHLKLAVEDQPAAAILQNAGPPIDLVAMRTHARHGLSRLFLGSVTDKVVRNVHLPVLVVPPHKVTR